MAFRSSAPFEQAFARADAVHGEDPSPASTSQQSLSPSSKTHAQLYHARMVHFAEELCKRTGREVSEAMLLAAKMQHIRRWEKPRADYPEGLAGYKAWREELYIFHGEVAADILEEAGYRADDDVVGRVKELIGKETLKDKEDDEMQLFEDTICCVFLELEYADFTDKLDDDAKMVKVVQRTWKKMSTPGREMAGQMLGEGVFAGRGKAVLEKALAG